MNQPSHYQTSFFGELASRKGVSLSVIYARGQTAQRRELGWAEPESGQGGDRETILPPRFPFLTVLQQVWRERRSTHLVNGVWAERSFVLAALGLFAVGAKFFFHSESPNPVEERGGLFRILKRTFGRWLVARSQGIFPIGAKGCRYFEALGVPQDLIFKFSYFVDGGGRPARVESADGVSRISYLGQFVERKRVGDLIRAAAHLHQKGLRLRLRLIGSGPCRESYAAQVMASGCGAVVSIEGPIAPAQVPEVLQSSDALVLPSGFDGWGLTVNEALHSGVPVVVSEACGAAEVVASHRGWGEVYPAGDIVALVGALERVLTQAGQYRPQPSEVDRIIGCRRMTDYFLDCVNWALVDGGSKAKPQPGW